MEHSISAARNLEAYLSGSALTPRPDKGENDTVVIYLWPYGVSYAENIVAFIAERLLDLLAVGLIACLATLGVPRALGDGRHSILLHRPGGFIPLLLAAFRD